MLQKPTLRDAFLLSCFAVLITLHPHYLHANINFFEYGLYLPGIDGILNGQVPYRDFFHLRGPFELYIPAFFMMIFGESIAVLSTYFYVGTVLTLIIWIALAQQLLRTRFIFYLFVPVFIGRTFPRVVFTYWGGVRYALGALAVLCAVRFFKTNKRGWIVASGVVSAVSLFTSIEIGVCALAGVMAALMFSYVFKVNGRKDILKSGFHYVLGFLSIAVPYVVYLFATQSVFPYIESVYAIVTKMQKVINLHFISLIPSNPLEALAAMLNPSSKNFRHMTPSYLYIFLLGYLIFQFRRRKFGVEDTLLICIGMYGLVMYNAAFRAIWASQFEMALQPEKILLFFLMERGFFYFRDQKKLACSGLEAAGGKALKLRAKAFFIQFLIIGVAVFSVSYAIQRYNRRFVAFKFVRNRVLGKDTKSLVPLYDTETRTSTVGRVGPMTIPEWQETEFHGLLDVIARETQEGEPVFMFPELGTYQFLIDRPFVGRFPMVTFSWFNDLWHEEMISILRENMPKIAVLSKDPGNTFPEVYFRIPKNKANYDEVIRFINNNYTMLNETKTLRVYKRKPSF